MESIPTSRESTIFTLPLPVVVNGQLQVHQLDRLPSSLLRLLISKQVFLIGSAIHGDLTRLQKQFNQLDGQTFSHIGLKQFAIQQGLIERKESGSLDALAEKLLRVYLCKDTSLQKTEDWETDLSHRSDLRNYPALDVYASRLISEKISETAPLERVQHNTPSGTRVAMLTRDRGEIAAYGQISRVQTPSFAAIRHVPSSSGIRTRTKAGALMLAQLKSSQGESPMFQVVRPVALQFDKRQSNLNPEPPVPSGLSMQLIPDSTPADGHDEDSEPEISSDMETSNDPADETLRLEMLDETSRKVFQISFDSMLLRNPHFIKQRIPRFTPPPSVLVPAIEHVFTVFGNALDAESGQPLFNKTAWQKAKAILFKCNRGTNKVEGHPLRVVRMASSRLVVNSMTDHHTQFNLQALARHVYGVDWEYHHDLALINRTSFLLNYLSDIINGADSYSNWLNTDPYECTTAQFQNLFIYGSEWNHTMRAHRPPLNLRATMTGCDIARLLPYGKRRINYNNFVKEWNHSAYGKTRYYVTLDVLTAYRKSWDKTNNARASQELITAQVDLVQQTGELFRAPTLPFLDSLKGVASAAQPTRGILDLMDSPIVPHSVDIELVGSHPLVPPKVPAPCRTLPRAFEKRPQVADDGTNFCPSLQGSTASSSHLQPDPVEPPQAPVLLVHAGAGPSVSVNVNR
ncbi:hypothetical protein C8J57DRAFT_1221969 [Mycena rebaudengoi]|nr:hypothetical protein C8J57DRAFT_1221969 [Mycena rebaudengoi]